VLEREKSGRLQAVGEVLEELSCLEEQGVAENSIKATARDAAEVTARPGSGRETRR